MVPKSDFFTSENLHPEWSFLGLTAKNKASLTERPGWLRLTPKSSIKPNTVIKNDGEHNYSLVTRFEFSPKAVKDEAGLQIMRGDETKFCKLYSAITAAGIRTISFTFDNTKYEAENNVGDTLWLKMVRINHRISGYYSSDGTLWAQVGQAIDISVIDSYSDFSTWAGTRQGLYVAGSQPAYFDLYIYRDAFTPILAECPANQFGTTRTALNAGVRNLDNIHNNDWALYAGVEFGNGEYYATPDSVEFTASSATIGGVVEVWLDSIDTGNKIASCNITNTGKWTEFKTFKTKVSSVSGRHDVYLKFVGTSSDKLFQLKWFGFTRKSDHTSTLAAIVSEKKLMLFPNPTRNQLSVQSGDAFETVEIVDLSGRTVFQEHFNEAVHQTTLKIDLKKGVYFLKVGNGKENQFSRLVVE
jgi:hypothetical protein